MIARFLIMHNKAKSNVKRLKDYILDPLGIDDRVAYKRISNCGTVDDEDQAANMMRLVQSMNTRVKSDPTAHLVLSFHERPDEKTLAEIEDYVMERLGYQDHQRITVGHNDTDHFHLHIAINKINPNTYKLHSPWKSYQTLLSCCDFIEKKYGLKHDNHEIKNTARRTRAKDMEAGGDCESLTGFLQRECMEELKAAESWDDFQQTCLAHNITFKKRGNGFVFGAEDYKVFVKASSVDRDLSFAKLEAKFGEYTDEMAKKYAKEFNFKKGRKKKAAQKAYQLRNMGNASPEGEELWQEYRLYVKRKNAESEQTEEEQEAARLKIRENPYVSETVGRQLLSCGNWREFHGICRKNGLLFKKRANGFAFYKKNDEGKIDYSSPLKATDVHRRFGKKTLEERLGSFKSPADLYAKDRAAAAEFMKNPEDVALLERLKKCTSWDEMYWECEQKGYFLYAEGGSLFIQHSEQVHGIFRLDALDASMKLTPLEHKLGNFQKGSVIHDREQAAKQAKTDAAMRNAFYARPDNVALMQAIVDAQSWEEVLNVIEEKCDYEVVNYANDLYFVDRSTGDGNSRVFRFGALNDHMSRDALEEQFGSLDVSLENWGKENEEQEIPVKTPSFEDLWGDYKKMSEEEREEWLWGKQRVRGLSGDVSEAYEDIPRGDSVANDIFCCLVKDRYLRKLWFELDRIERNDALKRAQRLQKALRRQKLENSRARAGIHNWRTFLQDRAMANDPRAMSYLIKRKDPTADFARIAVDKAFYEAEEARFARNVQKVTMQGTRIYADRRERNGEVLFNYSSTDAEIAKHLNMARERFGDVLLLNEDAPAEFQTRVAKAARELGITVTNIAPYLTKTEQAKAEAERRIREAQAEAEERDEKKRQAQMEARKREEEEKKQREEELRKKQEEDFARLEREARHIVDAFVREHGLGAGEYSNPVAAEKMRNATELVTLHTKGIYATAKKTGQKVDRETLDREIAVRLRGTGHSQKQVADILSMAEGAVKRTERSKDAAAYAFSDEGRKALGKQSKYVRRWKLNEETVNTAWFADEGNEMVQSQGESQERKTGNARR
ncbi:MAG: relaxase/mobilization nuclease domain-containing protein [Lachnospiraceae bacterium]|nr:relaxase/mobilization nuclease domain-containing protein [Lachnospiraceae bacterium]